MLRNELAAGFLLETRIAIEHGILRSSGTYWHRMCRVLGHILDADSRYNSTRLSQYKLEEASCRPTPLQAALSHLPSLAVTR